jgi:ubiquitin-protein ligase
MNSTVNKRVLKDITDGTKNLKAEFGIYLAPEENNYYHVHFVLPGPIDTVYEGGLYHGMIRLNNNHPMGPPNVYMMTPSGRFVPDSYPISPSNRGICFSYSAFHPELWSPVLNIETIIKGLVSFMCDDKDGGMNSILGTPDEKRKQMAKESHKLLIKEPIVQTLFPELCVEIANKTYVPFKIGTNISSEPEKSKTVEKEPSNKLGKKRESLQKEEIIMEPKKKSVKKQESSEEEIITRPKKKSAKKQESSEEEIVTKPKKKSVKKQESSEEEIVTKPKKKSIKKQESSEEEIVTKPKKKSVKKQESSEEEIVTKSKTKKKTIEINSSEEEITISKKKSDKKKGFQEDQTKSRSKKSKKKESSSSLSLSESDSFEERISKPKKNHAKNSK